MDEGIAEVEAVGGKDGDFTRSGPWQRDDREGIPEDLGVGEEMIGGEFQMGVGFGVGEDGERELATIFGGGSGVISVGEEDGDGRLSVEELGEEWRSEGDRIDENEPVGSGEGGGGEIDAG